MAKDERFSQTVHVAAALLVHDSKVLAAERSYGPHRGFELPGGKVEPHETPLEACQREVREELGIEICGLGREAGSHSGPSQRCPEPSHLATVTYDYDDFSLLMDVFLATPAPGQTIHDSEHLRLLWLSREELLSVPWLPADVEFLQRVQRHWPELLD